MKNIFKISILIFLASFCFADQNSIKQTLLTMLQSVDDNDWSTTKKQFTAQIFSDYSDITGQPGSMVDSAKLVDSWKSLLEHIDTKHSISNITISINKNEATVNSSFSASHHFLGLKPWTIDGKYIHKLKKQNDIWLITSITLKKENEKGNLNFFKEYNELSLQQKTVLLFLKGMEKLSIEAIGQTLHKDATQNMPFSPKGFPKEITGKKNLLQFFTPVTTNKLVKFKDIKFHPAIEPNKVIIEFKGEIITKNNTNYNNSYINIFSFKDNLIYEIKEYFNPTILIETFGPFE